MNQRELPNASLNSEAFGASRIRDNRSRIPAAIVQWRRLRRGMSIAEVSAIFGNPYARHATNQEEFWHYETGASVMELALTFRNGLLLRWSEPDPCLYMGPSAGIAMQPA